VVKKLEERRKRVAFFSKPLGKFEQMLLRDVHYAQACMYEDGEDAGDCVVLASKLCAMGYDPIVRKAVTEGTDVFTRFRHLRHEFLLVRGEGDWEGADFIVETRLREHFTIMHPATHFAGLLQLVPNIFVGSASRLMPVIRDMCEGMAESFEAKGLPLPPWRKLQAMISKWMPAKTHDTNLLPRRVIRTQHSTVIAMEKTIDEYINSYPQWCSLSSSPHATPPQQSATRASVQGAVEMPNAPKSLVGVPNRPRSMLSASIQAAIGSSTT
jgi:uncharacterized protein (TIGR01615 family)